MMDLPSRRQQPESLISGIQFSQLRSSLSLMNTPREITRTAFTYSIWIFSAASIATVDPPTVWHLLLKGSSTGTHEIHVGYSM